MRIGFVVEHKSSPDPGVMDQLYGYESDLYNRQGINKVFSLIVYNGQVEWPRRKTYQVFKRAGLPAGLLSEFEQGRMDFEAIFMWLSDAAVQERVRQMPMEVHLLLH